MKTVVVTNSSVRTVVEICLIPSAAHLIQKDRSSATTKNISKCYYICKYEVIVQRTRYNAKGVYATCKQFGVTWQSVINMFSMLHDKCVPYSPENTPPLMHSTLRQKWGGHLLECSIPPFIPCNL